MCPQAAPLLAMSKHPSMAPRDAAKSLDSKDICSACFVIDVSPALPGRGFVRIAGEFFTKLSTEFVHQGEESCPTGWTAWAGAEWSVPSEGRTWA
jgi:hypothetical protein